MRNGTEPVRHTTVAIPAQGTEALIKRRGQVRRDSTNYYFFASTRERKKFGEILD